MRYPTLALGRCEAVTKSLASQREIDTESDVVWRGTGESVDLSDLDIVLEAMRAELAKIGLDPALTPDKEPFEAEVAVACYPFLCSLPVEVLDDPGFWRYLAVSRFWWFVEWRESGPVGAGNACTYTDARRNTEQIPLRLFLRVRAVAAVTGPEFAKDLEKCTDFWRSHVIRVRTGAAPALAAAVVAMQKGPHRMKTTPLRAFARRLNRVWTNTQLGLYDSTRATALVEELRP
jgi:hypothetical protein